jgi:uncharacterized RDD family membrane protein YckC
MQENPYEPPHRYKPPRVASSEIKLAGRGARFVAFLLDFSSTLLLAIVLFFLVTRGLLIDDEPVRESHYWGLVITVLFAFVFSGVNSGLLSRNGQTIGKKLMRIRIVSVDGSYLPASRILARRYFPWWAVELIPFVGGIFTVVDALFIFRTDRRCIHDFIGGTIVVKA